MKNEMRMSKNNKDILWADIYAEAHAAARNEPMLASFLHMTVLRHESLNDVLAYHLSSKLGCATMDSRALMELFKEALECKPSIAESLRADIKAYYDRDPACEEYSRPLLYYKGFHIIQSYRITHWLWENGRKVLAYFLQSHVSEVLGADIHPAAIIGDGIMLDHGSGVVIGETAVIGNNVSMLHCVTLGGSGKQTGDRHPKIADGVLIGAGAKIIGNIHIGEGAKIGAGSVVLNDVPKHVTVVGVPAVVVGKPEEAMPALEMDQSI